MSDHDTPCGANATATHDAELKAHVVAEQEAHTFDCSDLSHAETMRKVYGALCRRADDVAGSMADHAGCRLVRYRDGYAVALTDEDGLRAYLRPDGAAYFREGVPADQVVAVYEALRDEFRTALLDQITTDETEA